MVLGASFDTPAENKAFAEAESFAFRRLSDRDRAVGRAYEAMRPPDDKLADYPLWVAYLIDPDGVIRRSYEVTDTAAFAGVVIDDLEALTRS